MVSIGSVLEIGFGSLLVSIYSKSLKRNAIFLDPTLSNTPRFVDGLML